MDEHARLWASALASQPDRSAPVEIDTEEGAEEALEWANTADRRTLSHWCWVWLWLPLRRFFGLARPQL